MVCLRVMHSSLLCSTLERITRATPAKADNNVACSPSPTNSTGSVHHVSMGPCYLVNMMLSHAHWTLVHHRKHQGSRSVRDRQLQAISLYRALRFSIACTPLPNASCIRRTDEGGVSSPLPQPRPSNSRVRHSGSITVPAERHQSGRATPEAANSVSLSALEFSV